MGVPPTGTPERKGILVTTSEGKGKPRDKRPPAHATFAPPAIDESGGTMETAELLAKRNSDVSRLLTAKSYEIAQLEDRVRCDSAAPSSHV